jgi:signal transduction histidine kinase/ActR/RegA family two-component response regulator
MRARPGLATFLEEKRDAIVARFVSEVQRKDLSPPGVERSLLVDHIPTFLDEIVSALTSDGTVRSSQDAVDTSATARQHGEQRWQLGYDLEGVIREYGVLRHAILALAKEANLQLSIEEFDGLAKCLSVGVSEAATRYVNAQKARLEFLTEAGQLLTSSLDYRSTLTRLTGLLVPRLGDWCAVHLDGVPPEEMAIAHVDPAKIAIVRELYARYPLPPDSQLGSAGVLRTGEAQLASSIGPGFFESIACDDDHLSLLRQLDTCSWAVVPLRVQDSLFGVLALGCSDSGRHYEQSDLVLFSELARRASVALDNARVYELAQQERSRVEAATRAKDEFVAMVSHELRTPLNAILGWVRLIRSGSLSPEKREHAFGVIERNANAQDRLVADLLDISKVITGKIRLVPAQVDLANVVDMAVESARPAADAKGITIEVNAPPGAMIRGDGDRLQQIVWNLVANAVKFTSRRGTVRVQLQKVASEIEITIADTGEGIHADFLPHVFEAFRQSDTSTTRAHGGLGIGLSITKHLVELHGGTIRAESDGIGRGATLVVRLPVGPLVSTTVGVSKPATQAPSSSVSLPTGLSAITVLVVDDEADARDLVALVLESCGMQVRAAASAAAAIGALASFTPSVIISDIGMPDEDGYGLIRQIRTLATDEKRNIPAIALTAFARNEDRTRALVEGFNAHLAKPVEPAALVAAVMELARVDAPRKLGA